jgi:hypothetical protein
MIFGERISEPANMYGEVCEATLPQTGIRIGHRRRCSFAPMGMPKARIRLFQMSLWAAACREP